jgi:tetratricopeptide (TPR) repeat protein
MTGRKDVFQKAMSQGHSAAWDQKWEQAAGFYQNALEEIPDDAQALLSYGLALLELQDYQGAMEAYSKASQVSPDDPIPMEKVAQISEYNGAEAQACEAAMRAASLYVKKGDVDKAIENWSLITRVDPEHLMAHSRLAVTHERLGRKNQAISEYLAIASLLQAQSKKGEAVQVIKHALQLDPNHENARQTMTLLHNDQPLPKPTRPRVTTGSLGVQAPPLLAEPKLEEAGAPEIDPIEEARKTALAGLANTLFELSEDREEAPRIRRGLSEITQGSDEERGASERMNMVYRLRQAIDFQTQGEDEAAAEELDQVVEMGLDIPAIQFTLGLLHTRTDRLESGMRLLQRSVNHTDYALGARLLLGQLLTDRGRSKSAALEYLEALRIADSAVVPAEKSDALRQLYEPLIEAHMQDAKEEDHKRLAANVAELLMRADWRKNLERARRELPITDSDAPPPPIAEVLTQAQSGQIVSALTNIHQHARNGFLRVAMDEAYRALDYAPTYLPLHSLMGELLLKQGRTEDSITKFTTVANAYSSRGDSVRATELFQRILQLSPMDLDTRRRLISQLIASGDIEAALEEYLGLADIYARLAESDAARDIFTEAYRLAQGSNVDNEWNARILHQIADLDLQRLDWRRAMQVFQQIRELVPDDLTARTNLVDLNLRMGQVVQALEEVDQFLGFLQLQGDFEAMGTALDQLSSNYPDNSEILKRMAKGYQQIGRKKDAVERWDRIGELALKIEDQGEAINAVQAIIALDPENVDEYRQLLAELSS